MKRIAIASLLGIAVLLAGCDSSPKAPAFQLTDITGAQFARDFQLIDHNGKPRTIADFKGKVVAIFFGYTRCPDACPTTMGELALVMKELGKDAERLQVLFITVDPERDTPEVLSRYVPAFHPSFLGLYGDAEATARTAKEFKIVYQKQPLKDGGYSVDHSAGSYLYDTSGRVRLFAQYGQGAQPLLHDIRLLLQAG
ncbi:MAG TPA: SCO family protein [Burkholderiales bacterium]|jgi:protein SCO1/2|nr:SCO family protein [Burkholderiales bacterium]